MPRILETEVMNDPLQVDSYSDFDKTPLINIYVSALDLKSEGSVLDIGCGSGDYFPSLTTAYPNVLFTGIDASINMLEKARSKITPNVTLENRNIPDLTITQKYDGIISSMLLHQLADPSVLWNTIKQVGKEGSKIYIMDMVRVEDQATRLDILNTYSPEDKFEQFRIDFDNSMKAAFTVSEVEQQLQEANLTNLKVSTLELPASWQLLFITGTI
jgi:trans-aconitate methyltransferase